MDFIPNPVALSSNLHNDPIDADDDTVWRDSLDATGNHRAADGSGGGTVDADCDVWQSHFGETWSAAGGAGSLSVPKPATAALVALGCLFISVRRVRRMLTH